jgi:peroxiredoxin
MAEIIRLNYDDPAPDGVVKTVAGQKIHLATLWKDRPLLLAFTRHFGCAQCKEMLFELMQVKGEIEKAGLHLVAVTQGDSLETAAFAEEFAPGIPCYADPQREAYRAYGLELGNPVQLVLSPQVLAGTARAKKHGFNPELPPEGQDVRQMSGTFIIGTDGRIRLPYYYDTIADHPPVDLLLKGVLSTDWNKPFKGPLA